MAWLKKNLENKFEIKTNVIGHGSDDDAEGKILNRIVRATSMGFEYEADPRHAELIVESMGVSQTKGAATAGVKDTVTGDEGDVEYLDEHQATEYRSLAARGNYLAFDRPDISFAVKELSRDMSRPSRQSWEKLKRLARCLKARPRVVWAFEWQDEITTLDTYTDANWAGCKASRKSTSGGMILAGSHMLKFWSKTQATIALSSAESELIARVKGSSESLGVMTLMEDYGIKVTTRLHMDASAAIGIIQRQGIGKIRHLSTNLLWVQQQQLREAIMIKQIDGTKNPSDLLTKHVPRDLVEKYCALVSCHFSEGRAEKAATLHGIQFANKFIKRIQMINDVMRMKISKKYDIDTAREDKECYHAELCKGQGKEDQWTHNGKRRSWTRRHFQTRMEFFTPHKSWHGPQTIGKLSEKRVTMGTFIDESKFTLEDNWHDDVQRHRVNFRATSPAFAKA